MRQISTALVTVVYVLGSLVTTFGQSAPAGPSVTVPPLIQITGAFQPVDGQPPSAVEIVTLSVYADAAGGLPVWQERQTVAIEKTTGRFILLLGASNPAGIPAEVFASGDAQWMSLLFERAGEREQARVRIASVPYALKASDAETLGGLPASAYLRAPTTASTESVRETSTLTSAAVTEGPSLAAVLPGTTNFLAKYVNASDVGNSAVYETPTANVPTGAVGIGTTAPLDQLHLRFNNATGAITGLAVQNLGNTTTSYSGMLFYDQFGALGNFQGFNNVTHEYRINNIAAGGSINFMLGSSSKFRVRNDGDIDVPGALRKSGNRFLHNSGSRNTFLGENAGNLTVTGFNNTATGAGALASNTTGVGNMASGSDALSSNTTGDFNTASGAAALQHNTTGESNMATGHSALFSNTDGTYNTASGQSALTSNLTGAYNTASGAFSLVSNTAGMYNTASGSEAMYSNTTGGLNVAIGYRAGSNATTGSNNIYLGTFASGVAGEANTMYLGLQGTQTKTVIAGIRGITTGLADAVPVVIDSAGQLGTVSSSRRFKEDIHDMGAASQALFALRPVTFRVLEGVYQRREASPVRSRRGRSGGEFPRTGRLQRRRRRRHGSLRNAERIAAERGTEAEPDARGTTRRD